MICWEICHFKKLAHIITLPDYKIETFYYWDEYEKEYIPCPDLYKEYYKLVKENNYMLSIKEFCNELGIEQYPLNELEKNI